MTGHRRGQLMLLVAIAATTSLLASACGSGEREPVAISLVELVAEADAYDGSMIRTRGRLRAFGDDPATLHYVIEDERSNRVQLLPNSAVNEYVGREVVVVGAFRFDDETGRIIRVETITRVE